VFHSSTPLLSASGDSPTARPSLWGGGLPPKTVSPNRITRDIKDLLVATVNENPQYQQALVRRMIAGKAPYLETLAAYYTIGKPREQVQVQTSPGVAELPRARAQAPRGEAPVLSAEFRLSGGSRHSAARGGRRARAGAQGNEALTPASLALPVEQFKLLRAAAPVSRARDNAPAHALFGGYLRDAA